jgi:GAF domain-containing protein
MPVSSGQVRAGRARHGDPRERLVRAGVRLHGLRRETVLHRFVVDEARALSGAQRVLLALEGPAGLQLAGSRMPRGEPPAELLAAVTPWLAEARHTREPRLRHGPAGADAADQRSCLVVPLIARKELLGILYADIDGRHGRLRNTDRDLLVMWAAQAAAALANLRTTEGLESAVAERTAQLKRRTGELAVIGSVQQGVAAKLDFQSIVDLVGDKLREVFHVVDISIHWWDDRAQLIHMLYCYNHGVAVTSRTPTRPHGNTEAQRHRWRQDVLVANTRKEMEALGFRTADGMDGCLSLVSIPILGAGQGLGAIVLEDFQRECAFGAAEVQLLTTVTASMGTALENAHLFDETQRLLKETEARNAELALINRIQQGVAGALNFGAIVDLVGDKLREVLKSQDISISWIDHATRTFTTPYAFEHGVRLQPATEVIVSDERWARLLARRAPVIQNTLAEGIAVGNLPGTDSCKSSVTVPMVAGGRKVGGFRVESHEREYAFGEAELRLLTTIAGSMGTALASARLFDETQRLLKDAERRSAELAVINSVQQGVGAELNFQAIVDMVGDKLREVFRSDDLSIVWRDEAAGVVHFLYAYEHGRRIRPAPQPERVDRPLHQALMKRQPVVLNNRAAVVAMGVRTLDGSDDSLSTVFVPMFVGERLLGSIVVDSFEREEAFDDAAVRLLSTVAASTGIGLENARLFNQTQEALRRQSPFASRTNRAGSSPPSPVLLRPPNRFMAMARVSCASWLIEPYDMAPVANRLTIDSTGSTSSMGIGCSGSLNSSRPRSV